MAKPADAASLIAAGISRSHAHHVMAGTRRLAVAVALWLLDEHGLIAPQLGELSKRDVEGLRRTFAPAPPSPTHRRAALAREAAKRADATSRGEVA